MTTDVQHEHDPWQSYLQQIQALDEADGLLANAQSEQVRAALQSAKAAAALAIATLTSDPELSAAALAGAERALAELGTVPPDNGEVRNRLLFEVNAAATLLAEHGGENTERAADLWERALSHGGSSLIMSQTCDAEAAGSEAGGDLGADTGNQELVLTIAAGNLFIGEEEEARPSPGAGEHSREDAVMRPALLKLLYGLNGRMCTAAEIMGLLQGTNDIDPSKLSGAVARALAWAEGLNYDGHQLVVNNGARRGDRRFGLVPGVRIEERRAEETPRNPDADAIFQSFRGRAAIRLALVKLGRAQGWFTESGIRNISEALVNSEVGLDAMEIAHLKAVSNNAELKDLYVQRVADLICNDGELTDLIATSSSDSLQHGFALDMLRRSHEVRRVLAEILRGSIGLEVTEDSTRPGTMSSGVAVTGTRRLVYDRNGAEIPPLSARQAGLPRYMLFRDAVGGEELVEDGGLVTERAVPVFVTYARDQLSPTALLQTLREQIERQAEGNEDGNPLIWARIFASDLAERFIEAGFVVVDKRYPLRRLAAELSPSDSSDALSAYMAHNCGNGVTMGRGYEAFPVDIAIGYVYLVYPDIDYRDMNIVVSMIRAQFYEAQRRHDESQRQQAAEALHGVAGVA